MKKLSLDNISSTQSNLVRILDNLKEGIIAHDLNRNIFFFNKAAEEITGHSREDVVGKDCHEAMGGPFCGEKCAFHGSTPTFKDKNEYSITIVTKTGESRRLEMTSTMMKDDDGQNMGVLASFRDVTDILDLQIRARDLTGFSNIIGRHPKMLEVFRQIRGVALYDSPVHICGETGTGK